MPKSVSMASIHDNDTSGVSLIDRVMINAIPRDMQNPDCYWYGDFDNDDVMTAFVKFKNWKNDKQEWCWTLGLMCKNGDVSHDYTKNQRLFPDAIVDLVNHGVKAVELAGLKTGYTLVQDAVASAHRNHWLRISDMLSSADLKINSKWYKHDIVEIIPGGELSVDPYMRNNVATIRFSVAQKIVRMTKI